MAELFAGEPVTAEVDNVSQMQSNEVVEAVSSDEIIVTPISEDSLVEEPNFFNVIQFH